MAVRLLIGFSRLRRSLTDMGQDQDRATTTLKKPLPHDSFSLTQRTGRAAGFRLVGNLASVILGLGLGVILARLLSPQEFGVYGIGLGIIALAEIFGSCGMLQALVQRKALTREDESTAAILQMGGALMLGGGLVVAGPTVEMFFGMPGLGRLVQLQSAVLVINALGLIPNGRLTRRLAFDQLTAIDISTRAISGVVSILLALDSMGPLALVIGTLTGGTFRTCITWAFAPGWVPILFRLKSAKGLLRYGTGILFIRMFNDLAHRLDILIIGPRLGAEVVGLYQRAYHLATMPLYQFTGAVSVTMFPAMAALQDEVYRFRRGYLGVVGLTSMFTFPLLTLLWTTADLLIPLLYGPRWNGAVPLLMSLGLVGYLRLVNNPNGLVTQARGRVIAEAMCQAALMSSTALFVLVGTFFGTQGVVLGVGLAWLLFLIIMTRLALSISGVSFLQWMGALRTTLISSTAMALTMLACKALFLSYMPIALLLVTVSCSGIIVYIGLLRILLTVQERQILERMFSVIPVRLRTAFELCMGLSSN
jgi:O-antigen/teichoic acid export membrane protein